ncbi:hypothetical protein AWB78_00267 [Caballeronia calidae]|uniref:Uncharacterized protein n=1 Tax=Caballeronia calidae TaxID=1777139 RepID=A0A157Z8V0_9BURK|nr:hypothetical protein AWB78_00267 [Caballeronia calidae]
MEADSTIVVSKIAIKNSIQLHSASCTESMWLNVQDLYYPGKYAFSLPIYEAAADKNHAMHCGTGLPVRRDLQSPYSPQFRI